MVQEMGLQMGRFGEGMLKGQDQGIWGGSGRGGLLGMEPVRILQGSLSENRLFSDIIPLPLPHF